MLATRLLSSRSLTWAIFFANFGTCVGADEVVRHALVHTQNSLQNERKDTLGTYVRNLPVLTAGHRCVPSQQNTDPTNRNECL